MKLQRRARVRKSRSLFTSASDAPLVGGGMNSDSAVKETRVFLLTSLSQVPQWYRAEPPERVGVTQQGVERTESNESVQLKRFVCSLARRDGGGSTR